MKKLFTLMWAIVCAALTVVSCTTDGPADEPQGPTYTSTITVTGAPEANLAPEAGELSLGYTIENPTLTGALVVTTEAAWVKVGEIGEATVALTYEANADAPGTPAREAVIKFAYDGAKDFLVTLKQDSAEAIFSVEFSEATSDSAVATLKSANPEIDWIALCYSTSDIVEAGFEKPMDFINDKLAIAVEMQMPYVFMYYQTYQTSGSMGQGDSEPFMCMKSYMAGPTDKLYLFVIGYNKQVAEDETDTSTFNGPVHVFEVPLLPTPILTPSATEATVTAVEGSTVIDVTLENAIEGAYVKASTEATWVVPTYADGKLTLAYEANTAALSRQATISVDYVKKNTIGEPGTEDYYEWEETLVQGGFEITLTQEADENAEKITFEIEVVKEHSYTHFDRIVVNVKPSNKEVPYVLNTVDAYNYGGNLVEIDWKDQVAGDMRYLAEDKVFKGDLTNHSIILYPANYNSDIEIPKYHVYAFALSEDKSAAISEASHILADVDLSDKPVVTWDVEKSGLTLNQQNRYEINVNENSEVVLYFNVANTVEGASLKLNDAGDNGILAGEPVIDNAAGTITFKISKFNPYNSSNYARPGFLYNISPNDMWGCAAPDLQLTLNIPTTAASLPYEESFYDGIGEFTITDNYLSEGLSYIWKHDSYHYMKASAFVGGKGLAGTSYLVSPVISLANATAPVLSFTHAVNHCPAEKLNSTCKLMVKEVKSSYTSWTTLKIPTHGTGSSWTWVESGDIDLSAYVGKNIVIAFVYSAISDYSAEPDENYNYPVIAPTWEVKNVKIAEK